MKNTIWLLLLPYIVIQAFLFPIAKDGLDYSSPYIFMALRYLIAGLAFLPICRSLTFDRHIIPLASAFAINSVLWIVGLEYVSAGDSAVLTYTMPFFGMISGVLILGERPRRMEIVGVTIGFLGVALYAKPLYEGQLLVGTLLTLGGAAAWGTYSVYLRKLKYRNNLSVVGTMYLMASLLLLIVSIPDHQVRFTPTFVFDLAYISIIGGAVSVFLWSSMLRSDRIGKVATFIFAIPAATIVIQSTATRMIPSILSIIGVAAMFLGIYISNLNF